MGDFDDIQRELREAVGGEIRAEAEENERLTELGRRRQWDLAEFARRSMNRGDDVTVEASGRTHRGTITAVGTDYLVVETESGVVEARLPKVIITVWRRRSGGTSLKPAAETWRARLAELEQNGESAILLAAGKEIGGVIAVVAADHIEVTDADGTAHVFPIELTELVLRPRLPSGY
jgi:hypothetical protein